MEGDIETEVDCQKDASAITVPHYAADLRSQIWKHGVKGYYDYVMGLMDSLRTEPLNVAAIGRDNSEKTGFLQAMCRSFVIGEDLHPLGVAASHMSESFVRVDKMPVIVTEDTRLSLNASVASENGFHAPDLLQNADGLDVSIDSGLQGATSTDCGNDSSATPEVFSNGDTPKPRRRSKMCACSKLTLKLDVPEVARAALAETKVMCHRPSEYPQLHLWDLPQLDYPVLYRSMSFDAYVITTSSRDMTRSDVAVATVFRDRKDALFLFADLDREMAQHDDPDVVSQIETFKEIRSHYRHTLYEHSLGSMPLFVVSTTDTYKFDFPDLRRQIVKWAQRKQFLRKDALARASLDALDDRRKSLLGYCSVTATASALCSAIPSTPVLALLGDSSIFLVSLVFQRYSFGLNGTTAAGVCLETTVDSDPKPPASRMDRARSLLEYVPCFTAWLVRRAVLAAIPPDVLAYSHAARSALAIVSGAVVFTCVDSLLRRNLAVCHKRARGVVDYVINRLLPMHMRENSLPSTRTSTRPSSPTMSL